MAVGNEKRSVDVAARKDASAFRVSVYVHAIAMAIYVNVGIGM